MRSVILIAIAVLYAAQVQAEGITIQPSPLDFGVRPKGTTGTVGLKVTNGRAFAVDVTAVSSSVKFKITSTLPVTVGPNETKSIGVKFEPGNSFIGALSEKITLAFKPLVGAGELASALASLPPKEVSVT